MRAVFLAAVLLFAALPVRAAEWPPAIVAAVKQRESACAKEGGRPIASNRFLRRVQLDGDGRDDFILDDGKFRCSKGAPGRCGSSGCSKEVYLSSAKDPSKPVLVELSGSYGVRKSKRGARITFQTRSGYVTYRFADGCAIPVSGGGERRC